MAITVLDLLELPHLALELLAGEAGVRRRIRWAHVSEVEDPTPWLEGGELLLTTGLGMPSTPADQVNYLRRISDAGAAGLVIVADSAPRISLEMLRTASNLGLPLIRTVLKQPFEAISKVVFAANSGAEAERMVRHLRIYGALRKIAARGAAPTEILSALSRLTGMYLSVHRWDGRPQFDEGAPYPRWDEAMAAVRGLGPAARGGLYARLPAPAEEPDAYIIQLDVAPPTRAFLVASGLSPSAVPDLVALHHIATIAAMQVMVQNGERAIRQRLSAELLGDLLDHGVGEATRSRVSSLGVTDGLLVGVAIESEERSRLTDAIHNGLLDHDISALVGNRDHHLVVLTPAVDQSEAEAQRLAAVMVDLLSAATEAPFAVGVGSTGSLAHAAASCSEAVIACSYAGRARQPVALFSRLDWPLAWLPEDQDRLKVLIDRTLGPIIAYDAAHGSSLLRSVDEYLRKDGRSGPAAHALRVHRNTLAHRLRKVEELTGLAPESVPGQAQLWLGLRAHDLTAGLPAAPGPPPQRSV